MRTGKAKGLKPLLIKYSAMLMGICYLMNPLQQQVFEAAHAISHALELPDSIISHDIDYVETKGLHKSLEHHIGELNHDHELLDLASSILKTSNKDNQALIEHFVKIKCDKHLASNSFVVLNQTFVVKINCYTNVIEALKKGYLANWKEPPQDKSC